MTYTLKNTVVSRHENLHYTKWGTLEKAVLAGDGITDWTVDMAVSNDEAQYINEKNQHSNMLGYAPKVTYAGELIPDNAFIRHVYTVGKQELVGQIFDEYEVESWAPVEGSAGEFAAYHRVYEIQPSNPGSGEGGGKLVMEGTFAQRGSTNLGKYNITTGTFTKGSFDYETGVFTSESVE